MRESIAPGFGIERMVLTASIVPPLDRSPTGAALRETAERYVSGLVDVLSNRIGADRLYRLPAVESDVPERSVRGTALLSTAAAVGWTPDWLRPVRLF